MKLSHSKMALLLKDPMSYHLKYDLGISQIAEKPALKIGSAVHWGLEHNTSCLDEFFGNPDNYTDEQGMAEAMVEAYLAEKEELFDLILTKKDGTKMTLLKEEHETFITGKLKSFKYKFLHDFIGIADLLIFTDEGIILIDYKTSSTEPDWNGYLEQIYRYIFMLQTMFPDKPVCKIGIINIRKSKMRQKVRETREEYFQRFKEEYKNNPSSYVYLHMYKPEDLDQDLVAAYVKNLSRMADMCQMITDNKMFYINFGAQEDYGKAEYYDIFYHTPGAYALYSITDTILDDSKVIKTEKEGGRRPCNELDLQAIDDERVINKYDRFKEIALQLIAQHETFDPLDIYTFFNEQYILDHELFNSYWEILMQEIASL